MFTTTTVTTTTVRSNGVAQGKAPVISHYERAANLRKKREGSQLTPASYQPARISSVHRAALASPISSLFEELLIMIFDDVITSETSSASKRAGWLLGSPRKLAGVSRTWRSIVFACPTLWRHVRLTPAQPIHVLKEHLRNSSPVPIHLTVHQRPFRDPIAASEPYSITALTAQLHAILLPAETEEHKEAAGAPVCHRVESITVDATECNTFLNFVLQTWTGQGAKFPTLKRVAMNGNVCATWSRACFFDGENAPALERLELSNVVIAYGATGLPWGAGMMNLTTLVWGAPVHRHGSLVVSAVCFHHIVSSFPNLTTLELRGHIVGLEYATVESLEGVGIGPLRQVQRLRVAGQAFANAGAAFVLFHLLPSVRHLEVRGRACSGPLRKRTVTTAVQGLMCLPKTMGWPMVLPELEQLEMTCVDGGAVCDAWLGWIAEELEEWKKWRETMGNSRKGNRPEPERVRVHMVLDDALMDDGDVWE